MPEVKGHLVLCENGYHLVTVSQLIDWLGPALYEAEGRGDSMTDGEKGVWRQARLLRRVEGWNERTARLFVCDCAEHVLHLFEQVYPNDGGPRHAIEIGRLYAEGNASEEALHAAWATACVAAGTAWAARAAAWATWADAWEATCGAWDAARATAWGGGDAEHKWQVGLLAKLLEEGEG
jgi:hypothetical protein